MSGRWISYLRVSTDRQGRSGLGLEAQRAAVAAYLNGGKWKLIAEVVEVESGRKNDRPKLAEALTLCRIHNATLVIAKLDRLSRDAAFLLGLQNAGVRFKAADMPEANELTVGIMAVMAQHERKMIAERTRAALAEAKKRGVALGNPANLSNQDAGRIAGRARRTELANRYAADLAAMLADIRMQGASSTRQIAAALNEREVPAPRGGEWSGVQVGRLLARLSA